MKRSFKRAIIFSIITVFWGCQGQPPKAARIITNLKDVSKIIIIDSRNGGEILDTIDDQKKINDFIDMFIPSSNKKKESEKRISVTGEFDGRIDIVYEGNKKISINLNLDCCYEFSFDANQYREEFTYQLGMHLSELFKKG